MGLHYPGSHHPSIHCCLKPSMDGFLTGNTRGRKHSVVPGICLLLYQEPAVSHDGRQGPLGTWALMTGRQDVHIRLSSGLPQKEPQVGTFHSSSEQLISPFSTFSIKGLLMFQANKMTANKACLPPNLIPMASTIPSISEGS